MHTDRYHRCFELHIYIAYTDRYIHTYIQIQMHMRRDIRPKHMTNILHIQVDIYTHRHTTDYMYVYEDSLHQTHTTHIISCTQLYII